MVWGQAGSSLILYKEQGRANLKGSLFTMQRIMDLKGAMVAGKLLKKKKKKSSKEQHHQASTNVDLVASSAIDIFALTSLVFSDF